LGLDYKFVQLGSKFFLFAPRKLIKMTFARHAHVARLTRPEKQCAIGKSSTFKLPSFVFR
jgi:hypothetical protein